MDYRPILVGLLDWRGERFRGERFRGSHWTSLDNNSRFCSSVFGSFVFLLSKIGLMYYSACICKRRIEIGVVPAQKRRWRCEAIGKPRLRTESIWSRVSYLKMPDERTHGPAKIPSPPRKWT